jgi:dihydroorotate dehydrogenase (fumarate)
MLKPLFSCLAQLAVIYSYFKDIQSIRKTTMPNLQSKYMGISIKNPLILSSSPLSNTPQGMKKAEDQGIGAIVLKSLFEEQITSSLMSDDEFYHPEAGDYINQTGMQLGPREYLQQIENAKKEVSVPIIASVNCVSPDWWKEFARQLNSSGADGLELNIALMPREIEDHSEAVEDKLTKTVEEIIEQMSIPVSVKIGPFFTALPRLAFQLQRVGVKSLVLFNRFYQFDVDIQNLKPKGGIQYSASTEIATPLRWLSILYNKIALDLSASTGFHDSKSVIKALLAGASSVQLASTIFKNGFPVITSILQEIEDWMSEKEFSTMEDVIGLVSQDSSNNPEEFERLQYIKALTGIG